MSGTMATSIGAGRAALRAGDAPAARSAFQTVLAGAPDDGDALEGMARADYLDLDFSGAIDHWTRAYASYRATGDPVGAVRVARMLACMYGAVVGDAAVMGGWLARARTLLADAGDTSEAGWVALNVGMFEPDRVRKEAQFRAALDAARRFADTELEVATLAYLGASLVHADRVDEGMVLLDEALAAVAGREVDNFQVVEETFCQLFSACEHAHDVARAEQWMRIGDDMASRRRLPNVSAFCRTHYGGILTVAGRWPEADAALTEAIRIWDLGFRALRTGALVRLADLRVRQGRFEEAEQLLEGLTDDPDAARPLAAMHLAAGRIELARDVIERALEGIDAATQAAVPLHALLVDVLLEAGQPDEAATAAERLALCARDHPGPYTAAVAALARGKVCLATGAGDPRACLREALAGFGRAQMPMELARARVELAQALLTERPDVAVAEARAALDEFERLEAVRDADAAAALLRSLGTRTAAARRTPGPLTKREAEVLELLGHGLSNPEIAERLFISRKTVEHHVGNILAKLGLRSRAEAAAYSARARPAHGGKPATE